MQAILKGGKLEQQISKKVRWYERFNKQFSLPKFSVTCVGCST